MLIFPNIRFLYSNELYVIAADENITTFETIWPNLKSHIAQIKIAR